jgi:pyrroline-5-carboxylate reductase
MTEDKLAAGTSKPFLDKTIAVLGAGKMGETLIRGLLRAEMIDPTRVIATARRKERLQILETELGVLTSRSNLEAVEKADWIFLCVKPQMADGVLSEISPVLNSEHVLVSILASVTTARIESALPEIRLPVVRAMPNTPCLISAGMTALAAGAYAEPAVVEQVQAVFAPLGRTLIIDEKNMDAVTGLSASGPAFIYVVIEALAEGGVKVGLPRSVATELAAQTCLGAARMVIETGAHPAMLKDEVTTPAGCTMDGLLQLEEGGLRVTLIKAIVEATRRASELVDDA